MNEELKKSPTTQDLTKLQGQQNNLEHDVEEFKISPWVTKVERKSKSQWYTY
jgi:hypothetical protein